MRRRERFYPILPFLTGLALGLAFFAWANNAPLLLRIALFMLALLGLIFSYLTFRSMQNLQAEKDEELLQLAFLEDEVDRLNAQEETRILVQAEILKKMQEGVFIVWENGEVEIETPMVKHVLLGTEDEKVVGPYIQKRNLQYQYIWELMQEAMEKKEPIRRTLSLLREGEAIELEVDLSPLTISSDLACLAFLRDQTHVSQLENMREDFVANVTHELKTPLTSIKGYIELLRTKERSREEQEQFLEIIAIESEQLQLLISELLTLSELQRKEEEDLEELKIYDLVEALLPQLAPLCKQKNISLINEVDKEFSLTANAYRIEQMLLNLMTNAIKYNKENGSVWVRSSHESGKKILRVEDNGIGIPTEDLPRVFERFYVVSKSRSRAMGGTGLGLAIVKHTAALYGASVQAYSTLGQGSSFVIRFPE